MCVWMSASQCKRVCARMCQSDVQPVTYTAAETTGGRGGDGQDQTKRGGVGGTWFCSDWLHSHTHKVCLAHTYEPLHPFPPAHKYLKERIERREGMGCLPPFQQQWIAPCARDWFDRSKGSAYICGDNKRKGKNMTKTYRQISCML